MQVEQPLLLTETGREVRRALHGRRRRRHRTGRRHSPRHRPRAVRVNAELRPRLKKEGLLTRDARAKERKKYGMAGARKRFQFSKR